MAKLNEISDDLTTTARIEYDMGIFATIRPMPNPEFDAYLARLQKPQLRNRRKHKGGSEDADQNDMIKQAIAHTVLLNVEGLDVDDEWSGTYTPEWAVDIFRQRKYYNFYQFIRTEAATMSVISAEDDEDAAGN